MSEKDGVDISEVKEFVERRSESKTLIWTIALFLSLALLNFGHSIYSVYDMWTDDSIPLVVCPRDFDLDSPVLMKTINETNNLYVQDRWLRGFIRKYVTFLYPRTVEDVKPFFEYIMNHSDGDVYYNFQARYNSAERIEGLLRSGSFYHFYVADQKAIRIRTLQGTSNQWAVEIDGYMLKHVQFLVERSMPTLKMTIEAVKPTQTNPEGLVVTELYAENLIDPVSGKTEIKEQ